MSEVDTNSQKDGGQKLIEKPGLSFFERSLLGIVLWSTYAIAVFSIIQEHSYFASDSVYSLAYGWLFLIVLSVISYGMWRILLRGRVRAAIAVVCLMVFNLAFGGPFHAFEQKPEPEVVFKKAKYTCKESDYFGAMGDLSEEQAQEIGSRCTYNW